MNKKFLIGSESVTALYIERCGNNRIYKLVEKEMKRLYSELRYLYE
jgi:hypothetical protein